MPGRGEGAQAFAEALVVDGAGVDGEEAHEENQIPPAKHHPPDLFSHKHTLTATISTSSCRPPQTRTRLEHVVSPRLFLL